VRESFICSAVAVAATAIRQLPGAPGPFHLLLVVEVPWFSARDQQLYHCRVYLGHLGVVATVVLIGWLYQFSDLSS
jgi:hypothetical protein